MSRNYREKIGIVGGSLDFPRIFHSFEFLTRHFDVSIFIFDSENGLKDIPSSMDVRLYKEIENMSGFMRGLEEDLADFRLIICLESSRLHSFQALKAAKLYGAKLILYSTETDPFQYVQFENIRTMQKEFIENSVLFLAPNQRGLNPLSSYAHVGERFLILPFIHDSKIFNLCGQSSQKFRSLLGWSEKNIVVLYYGSLNSEHKPERLIEALKLLKAQDPSLLDELKILYVGTGNSEKQLKYMAYDSGLGGSIYFMHQDFEPVMGEIYRASDFVILSGSSDAKRLTKFPFEVYEAMACGSIPIVPAGSLLEDLAGKDACLSVENTEARYLALTLRTIISDQVQFQALKEKVIAKVDQDRSASFAQVEERLISIGENFSNERLMNEKVDEFIHWIEDLDDSGKISELEKLLQEPNLHKIVRGRLLCAVANIYFQMGFAEKAIHNYENAVATNSRDVRPLLGLGFIAWNSQSDMEAEAFFKKVLALDTNNQQAALGLGLVYYRKGRYLDSVHWLTKSLLDPLKEASTALSCIAKICVNHLEGPLALRCLQSVIERIGEHSVLMSALRKLGGESAIEG